MKLDGCCRAVLLDVGWTLVYPSPRREVVIPKVLRERGYVVALANLEQGLRAARAFYQARRWQQRAEEGLDAFWYRYYMELLAHLEPPIRDPALAWVLVQEVEKSIEYHLYSDTLAMLTDLRQSGFATGAVSNWSPRLPALCEIWGLSFYLDTLVVSDVVGLHKPDPRIFAVALDALQVPAKEAVYVGDDYEADVQGARAAGIQPVLLDRQGKQEGIDCLRIHSLADLTRLLGPPCSSC